MYNCRETTALASDYLEGELSWWQRMRFKMHLWMCDRCNRFLRQLRATIALLRDRPPSFDGPPSESERQALVERFRAARPPKA